MLNLCNFIPSLDLDINNKLNYQIDSYKDNKINS